MNECGSRWIGRSQAGGTRRSCKKRVKGEVDGLGNMQIQIDGNGMGSNLA